MGCGLYGTQGDPRLPRRMGQSLLNLRGRERKREEVGWRNGPRSGQCLADTCREKGRSKGARQLRSSLIPNFLTYYLSYINHI